MPGIEAAHLARPQCPLLSTPRQPAGGTGVHPCSPEDPSMNFSHGINKSADILRSTLPLISKHGPGFHPVSYAVWYEYVSGENAELLQDMKQLLSEGGEIDNQRVLDLFRRHVPSPDHAVATRVAAGVQEVLGHMARTTGQTQASAEGFGESLSRWSEHLPETVPATHQAALDDMLTHTRSMVAEMADLKAQLKRHSDTITQLQDEVRHARNAALLDALTGLANRAAFDRALTQLLSEHDIGAYGQVGLLMVDVDHFKRVNDTWGHVFGDKVLQAVAKALRDNIKGRDMVARYGGEEFAVLLPDTGLEGSQALAEKLRSAVERIKIGIKGQSASASRVTVSLGVAVRRVGEPALAFVARADEALYAAKASGRNLVRCDTQAA
jgi:diguanylate cyclase